MRCFYCPDCVFSEGACCDLPADLQHHISTVLRLTPGIELQLFDGLGSLADVRLLEQGRVEVLALNRVPEPLCRLTLVQGVPKKDKLELVLQKGTELGVNRFIVANMARSVGQLKPDRKEKQRDRWQKIIQEASRQSRQYFLPQLVAEDSFTQALAQVDAVEKLVLWEESSHLLAEALPPSPVGSVAVVVGPEGGISAEEVRLAEKAGFKAVSLGPRILRTETAGLAIMSILQYLYGDLASGRTGESDMFKGKG